MMTNTEFIRRLQNIAKDYKTLYVMGCFGAPMTAANKRRYTSNHEYNRQPGRAAMINAASADTFGFDCGCLIKGVLWGWKGDKDAAYGGAAYASNGVPDIGADQLIRACEGVSGDFSEVEPGEAVWLPGHIGVYVGGGLAVECTPRWGNKVQVTACNRDVPGYHRRDWEKHGRLPYVAYARQSEPDRVYTVKGDTLGAIAKMYGLTAQKLADHNGIKVSAPLYVGQKIRIPKSGKTVDELAREVIRGDWGNGKERRDRLAAAGYDYSAVQRRVNEILR